MTRRFASSEPHQSSASEVRSEVTNASGSCAQEGSVAEGAGSAACASHGASVAAIAPTTSAAQATSAAPAAPAAQGGSTASSAPAAQVAQVASSKSATAAAQLAAALTYDKDLLAQKLRRELGSSAVETDKILAPYTTFKIGGAADIFVTPDNLEDLSLALRLIREASAPVFVLGRGSNLLIADAGFRGVVVALCEGLSAAHVEGDDLICQAGVSLGDAAEMACSLGLSGLEFACGIPGSVGGAVFMNAGAYGGQISGVLASARVLSPEGQERELTVDELDMGYRTSRVRKEQLIVMQARFALQKKDASEIRALMDDLTRRRAEKQPQGVGSAGSTFKRPEGHFAGALIEAAGLVGFSVGDAQVSTKHAGFVVNTGNASAQQVLEVIRHVQNRVLAHSGVRLEPEVRFLGQFPPELAELVQAS